MWWTVHALAWVLFWYLFPTFRADSRFALSQWEMALLCNDISHWLGSKPRISPAPCSATQDINNKITLFWVHKQFATPLHTLFSLTHWNLDKKAIIFANIFIFISLEKRLVCWFKSHFQLKFVRKGPADNRSVLVQVMAITWTNDVTDPCHHIPSISHNELMNYNHSAIRTCNWSFQFDISFITYLQWD